MQSGNERLPWLADEPASAAATASARPSAAQTARPKPAGKMWPFYLLLALLVGAVGLGAWWLGTRQHEAPPPQLPVESPLAIPVTRIEQPPAAPSDAILAEQAQAVPERTAEPNRRPAPQPTRSAPPAPEPTDTLQDAPQISELPGARRSVFPADEPVSAPLPRTGPQPVVIYHPQPNRGRVVQLGAFPTRAQAEQTWKRVIRRYPYLASKPKMVNTVEVRGVGSGRRTRMYRLQLGTSSQAQSAVICQQLERAGMSCVVVY
jgi:hypothetical protein